MKVSEQIRSAASLDGRLCWRAFGRVLLPALLLLPTAVSYADSKEAGLFDEVSEFARASLTDHRQAGSFAGSLLGAALSTHPAGSIVGGIVGFFAGKLTMSTEDEQTEGQTRDVGAVKGDELPLPVQALVQDSDSILPAAMPTLTDLQAAALAVPLVSDLPRADSDGRLVQLGAFEAESTAARALLLLRNQGLLAGASAVSIFGQDNIHGDRVYRILMSPESLTAAAACDTIKTYGGSCAVIASTNLGG